MSGTIPSHISDSFAGEIVAGDNAHKLALNAPAYYQHFLNTKCKVGDKVTVIVTNKRPKRTQQQNAYLWGVYYPAIAAETGETDIERLHALFKAKFLTVEIVEVLGERVRIMKSTTELSKQEFSEYIEKIAAETGVEPPPVENFDLAPMHSDPRPGSSSTSH